MPVTDQQKLMIIAAAIRRDANATPYGRFVPDAWVDKVAADILTDLKDLEQGVTI